MKPYSDQLLPAIMINLRRLVILRWCAIAGQTSAVVVAVQVLNLDLPLTGISAVIVISIAFNLYAWRRVSRQFGRWPDNQQHEISYQEFFYHLLFDIVVLSILLYFTGGATNPFGFIYLLPITISAAVLSSKYTWTLAVITMASYSFLIWQYIPLPEAHHNHTESFNLHVFGMWLGFVVSAIMVAYFVVGMGNSLRQQERVLVKAREDALRNERLVAIGTLAASTAHELGTPLGTMALVADELQHDCNTDDAQSRENIKTLQLQIKRCKSALAELSVSAGNVSASDGGVIAVDDYLAQLLEQWQQTRSDIEVNTQWQGKQPVPELLVDRTLSQALYNILDNAAEATASHIDWLANWDDKQLHMEIRDYGSGLHEDAKTQAGKTPFSSKQDGMGLGLFLAHAVIERFGGSVSLYNHKQGGLCTSIQLPLTDREKV